jgi:hypothetical protein
MIGDPPDEDWSGKGFVRRTIRTAAVVAGIVVLVLLSYGQLWAVGPFLGGIALSSVLLYLWDVFVRSLLNPDIIRKSGGKRKGRLAAIIGFSLIKYPLVGLLLYMAVRMWGGDPHRALAFLGGFILLHVVIGLRAVSRALLDRNA